MSDLHDELRALGRDARWPPTPDVATAVAPRLAPRRRRRPAWRPALALPAVLAVVVAGVAIVPPARTAVLDVLGLAGGEQVVRVPSTPTAPPTLAPGRGRALSLAQARAAVAFPVRVPRALGPPPEVRLDRSLAGGAVSLIYGQRAVLTAFRGRTLPFARKMVGPKTRVVAATVGGRPALFLTGAPVQWIALDEHGNAAAAHRAPGQRERPALRPRRGGLSPGDGGGAAPGAADRALARSLTLIQSPSRARPRRRTAGRRSCRSRSSARPAAAAAATPSLPRMSTAAAAPTLGPDGQLAERDDARSARRSRRRTRRRRRPRAAASSCGRSARTPRPARRRSTRLPPRRLRSTASPFQSSRALRSARWRSPALTSASTAIAMTGSPPREARAGRSA